MINIPEKLLPIFLNNDGFIQLGDADLRGASGGRGSGKTVSFVKVAAYLGAAQKLNIALARYFQASIQTGLFAELKHVIQTEKSDFLRKSYIVGKNYVEGKNGTHFLFKGLARNIHELKGDAKLNLVLIDEAEKVPKEAWQTIIPTIREANRELWACWNPQDEDSEVHKIFIENGKNDPRVRHATCNWRDNPWFSEKSNRDRLRHLENDPTTYNHIWEGEFLILSDAQILSGAWDVQEFTPDWTFGQPLFGADFGFSQDPSTLIKCWIKENYLFVSDEAYKQGVELDDMPSFYDQIEQSRTGKIYGDCSRPETISYIKRNGFRISPCNKWSGSVEDGIAHLRGAYKKIIIHPRCKQTIKECRNYQYKIDERTGRITSTILDKNNHCIDALRYALNDKIKRKGTGSF